MSDAQSYAVAVHGGADNPRPGKGPPGKKEERRAALCDAARSAAKILKDGGGAVDAVIRAVTALEDCPLFNAGRGSVFAADGTVEMDASVMEGETGRAGGVSTVKTVRNPVLAARAVMVHSPHTLLCGAGAEAFAAAQGLAMEDNAWFHTPYRREQLRRAKAQAESKSEPSTGTVGCVARDRAGNLGAATSTGGFTNKAPGRVSDSAVIGAGTWAQNGVCAVSCTGTGDLFIARATARDIAARMAYRGIGLEQACGEALDEITAGGGFGGAIAVDARGNIVTRRHAERMDWAWIRNGEEAVSG